MGQAGSKPRNTRALGPALHLGTAVSSAALVELIRLLARHAAREIVEGEREDDEEQPNDEPAR
jgi:hypothetical protein